MSIAILPYINEVNTTTARSDRSAGTSEAVISDFQSALAAADRAQQAMAVDALIAAGNSGGVSPATIQKILGFNPLPNIPAAPAASVSSAASATDTVDESAHTAAQADSALLNPASVTPPATASSENLDDYFQEAAETYHVDVKLLKAIARAESGYNPSATSSAGAMGVMQLMPSTARSLGIDDPYNAHDNIMGGARIISQNLTRYNGDLSLALAAYNAGSGNVEKYGGVPPFTETQNYIKKVLNYYEEL